MTPSQRQVQRNILPYSHILRLHKVTLAFAEKRKVPSKRVDRKHLTYECTYLIFSDPFLRLSNFFFSRSSRRRFPFLLIDIFPRARFTPSSLRNCFNTVAHSPGDIIENKIQTHLLLGQSYPCCQSRCHTHTTLTSTPKSDIVCWNRPSLYLFSRT